MKNLLLVVVLVLVVVIGGYFLMKGKSTNPPVVTQTEVPTPTLEQGLTGSSGDMSQKTEISGPSGEAMTKGTAKEFAVEGSPFSYTPNVMRAKKGDTVKVVFTNKEGFHDWVIDEFNARTKQIAAGQSETVTFVADKVGAFEYYCSVDGHRAKGMKGNLIVE